MEVGSVGGLKKGIRNKGIGYRAPYTLFLIPFN
jgi:hypothetical protein